MKDIDIIYLTGDFVPHNIWNTSITGNIEVLMNASSYIQDYFPRAKVIPVIGNHETHPVNMCVQTYFYSTTDVHYYDKLLDSNFRILPINCVI